VIEHAQRTASLNDIEKIWTLIKLVADDVPISLASEAEQEKALTELMECCTGPHSPIALDGADVVGVVLAKRDLLDWGLRNVESFNISLAAVSPAHRGKGVLKSLLSELLQANAPIYIGVKAADAQGLPDELKSCGFSLAASGEQGELYKWEPAAAEAKAA